MARKERRDKRLPLLASYPMEFKHWAWWQIDLSISAPTVDQQCAELYPAWLALQQRQ